MEAARRSAQQQLCLAYNARLVPNSPLFPWPDARRLLAAQEGLDEALFGDVQGAEATEEYDRAFLKHLVARTERAISNASESDEAYLGVPRQDWAVNEALLERYVELVSLPQNVTYVALLTQRLRAAGAESDLYAPLLSGTECARASCPRPL